MRTHRRQDIGYNPWERITFLHRVAKVAVECRPRVAYLAILVILGEGKEEVLPKNEANLKANKQRKGIELGAFVNTFGGLELNPDLK